MLLILQITLFILAVQWIFGDHCKTPLIVANGTCLNPSDLFLLLFLFSIVYLYLVYNRSIKAYVSGGKLGDGSILIIIVVPLFFTKCSLLIILHYESVTKTI